MLLGRQLDSIKPVEDSTTTYWHGVDASLDEQDYSYKQNKWGDPSQRRLLLAMYRE